MESRDAAELFAPVITRAAGVVARLKRQAFSPSEEPISPSEALRLGLETTLDFATGEFGVGGFWGDLLGGPRSFSASRPWLFPVSGKDASVDVRWLQVAPSQGDELGVPWFAVPMELTLVRAELSRVPAQLPTGHEARQHVARTDALFVPPLPWSSTFKEPIDREWILADDWHVEYSRRRSRFFAELEQAISARDTLVFVDAEPRLKERPPPPLPEDHCVVQPGEIESLWNAIHALSLQKQAISNWNLKGIPLAIRPVMVPKAVWARLRALRDAPATQETIDEAARLFKKLPR